MGSQETTTAWQAGELHALADLLANLTPGALAADHLDHLDHLDQLEALERIKAATAHAQVTVTTAFADAADTEHVPTTRRRTPPRAMSIGAEVALATLASPMRVSSGCCCHAACATTSP